MAEYGNFCPVNLAAEVVCDRWTPMILREMFMGSTRFNDIARGLPGISRSLLVQRLKHLERKGVLERWPAVSGRGHEYRLTPAGDALQSVVLALGEWSVNWLFDELQPGEIDAQTLTWWLHRNVDPGQLPPGRVVIEIDHTAPVRERLWMVIDRGEASVCPRHPGFDVDVVLRCATPALANVFSGAESWRHALASGAIRVDGPPRLAKALPRWFRLSPFAPMIRDAVARQRRDQPVLTAAT